MPEPEGPTTRPSANGVVTIAVTAASGSAGSCETDAPSNLQSVASLALAVNSSHATVTLSSRARDGSVA